MTVENTCVAVFTERLVFICVIQTALDLTAPASDALLKNRKNAWIQVAGHPGEFYFHLVTCICSSVLFSVLFLSFLFFVLFCIGFFFNFCFCFIVIWTSIAFSSPLLYPWSKVIFRFFLKEKKRQDRFSRFCVMHNIKRLLCNCLLEFMNKGNINPMVGTHVPVVCYLLDIMLSTVLRNQLWRYMWPCKTELSLWLFINLD